jgi:hypothetical protein
MYLLLFGILFLFTTVTAYAQNESGLYMTPKPSPSLEYALPYPGILPDHPLYFMKNMRDKILIFFSRDLLKKSQLKLLLSDKHLVMGQILSGMGKNELSVKTLTHGEKYLLESVYHLSELKKTGTIPVNLTDKYALAAKKHQEVIVEMKEGTSDNDFQKELVEVFNLNVQASEQISLLK